MNSDDLHIFKCGYITLLPNDTKGRGLICCDASRLEKDLLEARLRCLFYMLHVATESASKNEGVALMFVMNKLSFERTRNYASLAQLLNVFPVKVCAIHIVRQPARLGVRVFEDKVVPAMTALLLPTDAPLHVHSGTPSCDLRKELARHDFDSKNLPRSLGGGWTYQHFLQWREKRLSLEEASSLEVRPKNTPGVDSGSGQNDMGVGVSQTLTPQGTLLQNEQQLIMLLEINRLQQVANGGVFADHLAARLLSQRSSAEAATVNNEGPAVMDQVLLNRPLSSVQVGSSLNEQQEVSDLRHSFRAASGPESICLSNYIQANLNSFNFMS